MSERAQDTYQYSGLLVLHINFLQVPQRIQTTLFIFFRLVATQEFHAVLPVASNQNGITGLIPYSLKCRRTNIKDVTRIHFRSAKIWFSWQFLAVILIPVRESLQQGLAFHIFNVPDSLRLEHGERIRFSLSIPR